MRRKLYYETQANPSLSSKNLADLIYQLETRNEPQLQEILSSPRFQEEFYGQGRPDFRSELMRLRMQQQNGSLASLTDSEFYNDDQGELTKEKVAVSLSRLGRFLEMLSRLPFPRMSFTGMGICFLIAIFICPRACCENLLFPAFRLAFGTLYPAYASYKAVRTKNVKEYVKWMMYWIVYAFFTCIETFTDIFLSWFPFYYELKVVIVLWLLSPATKGSSTLYRKFVHPMLTRREQEIDDYLNQARERGYTAVLQLGSKGVNYATNVIMQTALKGGGNLVQTIRRSYSLSDLSEPDVHRTQDEIDEVVRPQRLLRPRSQTVRSSSGGRQSNMYFSEVDVEPKGPPTNYNYIRSSEDISSGYSSAEPISGGLSRTSSMTNTRSRFKAKRAEEEIYSEMDEFNTGRRFSSPLYPDTISYNQNLHSEPPYDQPAQLARSKDEYMKKEAYLKEENQRKHSEKGNEDHNLNAENIEVKNMSPEMRIKYEMFCKWLENSEKIEKMEQDEVIENIDKIETQSSEEDFKDTVSMGSEDDEFTDVYTDIKLENKSETLEKTLGDKVSQEVVPNIDKEGGNVKGHDAFSGVIVETGSFHKKEDVDNQNAVKGDKEGVDKVSKDVESQQHDNNIPKLERLLDTKDSALPVDSLFRARMISTTTLESNILKISTSIEKINEQLSEACKRPAYHGKGKAPEPPETSSSTNIADENSSSMNTLEKAPEPPETLPKTSTTNQTSPTVPHSSTLQKLPEPLKTSTNISTTNQDSSSHSITTSLQTERSSLSSPDHSHPSSSLKIPVDPIIPKPEDFPRSRSSSPTPKQEGKKSKKSIFKNYLPSLFRSESPKRVQPVVEEFPKETQL